MKRDVKQEIILAARTLFNEHGYNAVTMRDVADSLGISVGNLTYHFKKKESLIEAVVMDKHKSYQKQPDIKTLLELDCFFRKITEHNNRHLYYFRHYAQLSQLCPEVYQMQLSMMQEIYDTIKSALLNLREARLIKQEMFAGQTNGVIQSLMTVSCYAKSHFERLEHVDYDTRECLWSVVSLMLTEGGREIFSEQIM